jgi:hypothetical protein
VNVSSNGNTLVVNRSAAIWVLLTAFALIPAVVIAQDHASSPVAQESSQPNTCSTQPAGSDAEVPMTAAERKRKAVAGLAAVGGIAILGFGVIAVTMVGARRLRRLARDMGPAQKTQGNDFWFLKPPKPVANHEISSTHRPPLDEKRDET